MEITLNVPDSVGVRLKEMPNFQQFAIGAIQAALKAGGQSRYNSHRKLRREKLRRQLAAGAEIMRHDYETDEELTLLNRSLASEGFLEYETG